MLLRHHASATILLAVLVLANHFICAEQTSTSTSSSTSTPSIHVVTVGSGGDNAYHPNQIIANPGDIVTFQFWPTNHSVVRGEYTGSEACGPGGCNPCVPYNLIHPGATGFFFSKNFLTQSIPGLSNIAV